MAYLPIYLDVHNPSWPPVDAKLKNTVNKRDKGECQYCGFTSTKFQTARAKDYKSKKPGTSPSNYVTSCLFCDQCFKLDRVGVAGSGVLIWLPEMSQAMLGHIARAIYVGRAGEGKIADAARVCLDSLLVRRYEARRRLGTDDPMILSTVILDGLENANTDELNQKLDGIRLLPMDKFIVRRGDNEKDMFDEIIKFWTSKDGPFAAFDAAQWSQKFDSINAKMNA